MGSKEDKIDGVEEEISGGRLSWFNNWKRQEHDSPRSLLAGAGSFLGHFIGNGTHYCFGVFLVPLTKEFDVGRGIISLLGATTGGLMLGFGVPGGYLSDRIGFWIAITMGAIFLSVGLLVSSWVGVLWLMFLTYPFLVGVGESLAFLPSVCALQMWFKKYRGVATGLAVAGGSFGSLALPPLISKIEKEHGYRIAMRWLSLVGLGVLVVASLIHRRKGVEKMKLVDPRPFLKTRTFMILFVVMLCFAYGRSIPALHIVPFAKDHGIEKVDAAFLVSLIGIWSGVGRIVISSLGDKFPRRTMTAITLVGAVFSSLLWLLIAAIDGSVYWALGIFSSIFGFFSGGFLPLMPAIAADRMGLIGLPQKVGFMYIALALGVITGPTVTGLLHDIFDSYIPGIGISAGFFFLGFCFTFLIPSKDKTEKQIEMAPTGPSCHPEVKQEEDLRGGFESA